MLELIEQALDFVVALRIGDKLPSELNGGNASWDANEQDRKIAASRVRFNLTRCVFARMGKNIAVSGGGSPGWEDTGKNRELLKQAIDDAVTLISGTDAAEITDRTCVDLRRDGLYRDDASYLEPQHRANPRKTASDADRPGSDQPAGNLQAGPVAGNPRLEGNPEPVRRRGCSP